MNGPKRPCPMAQFLQLPQSDPARRLTADYAWALDAILQPGTDIARVRALRVAGYVSSVTSQCACLVKLEIYPQRFIPPADPEPPRWRVNRWCRRLDDTTWQKGLSCVDIPAPTITTEQALVALTAAKVESYIDDPINRERLLKKIRPLGHELARQNPVPGQEVSWSLALKVHEAQPITPPPTTEASMGIYIGRTNQIDLDDDKKHADQVWIVEDYGGHRYLVRARDVDWVE